MKQWTCVRCCEGGRADHKPVRTCTCIITMVEEPPEGCLYPSTGNVPAEFVEESVGGA
jgi:hypothetical protein